MKKRIGALLLAAALSVCACGAQTKQQGKSEETNDVQERQEQVQEEDDGSVRIGVILSGDETERYSISQIDGICAAADTAGIETGSILWKERIEPEDCGDAASALIDAGCTLIVAADAAYLDEIAAIAEKEPDTDFAALGARQETAPDNLYTAEFCTYEAAYAAGAVTGYKLLQLEKKDKLSSKSVDADGNIKLGYVATQPEYEVYAEYNAFYQGVCAVCDHAAMQVEYTGFLKNATEEASAADILIRSGCAVLASNTQLDAVDKTVQRANEGGKYVYVIGHDTDAGSGISAALTSVKNVWSVYYTALFEAKAGGTEMPLHWEGGYGEGAVALSALGESAAPQTAKKLTALENKLVSGEKSVPEFGACALDGIAEAQAPEVASD